MRASIALRLLALAAMLAMVPAAHAASVAGTNGKIVFTSDRSGNFDVYVMNADGSGVADVTNNSASDVDPSISPDGTKVAFASNRFGSYDIFVANLDGSGTFRLTSDVLHSERHPVWSPDGNSIAYESDAAGNWDVNVMQANGSGQTQLTSDTHNDYDPAWAPDGGAIAFTSERDNGGTPQIFTMSPSGGNQQHLIYSAPERDCEPTFSPDSTTIAYVTHCGAGEGISTYTISGANPFRTLTNGSAGNDDEPNWSPDGSKIAFSSDRGGRFQIYTMNADGSGITALTSTPGEADTPSWGANLANVGLPFLAGTATVGNAIVASSGSWLGAGPITFSYQWLRCNTGGDGCQVIGGATGLSYRLTSLDVNGTIRVRVTATNPSGSASANSLPLGGIALPSGPGLPVISGSLTIGSRLISTTGAVGASLGLAPVTYSFQWQSCDTAGQSCSPITGATNPSYVIAAADSQHTLRVTVTATNSSGSATGTSLATEVVGGLAPSNTALPVVAGSPVIGQTLTASSGTWVGAAGIAYTYQWQRCDASGANCKPIAGANAATYVIVADDSGTTLLVEVTATNAQGIVSVQSLPTLIVGAAAADPGPGVPAATVDPRVVGAATVGSTITVTGGGFVGAGLKYAYQWQRCDTTGRTCGPISGSTSASYKPVEGDVGSTVRVFVTASNSLGSATAVSDITPTVVVAPAPSATGSPQSARTLVLRGSKRADRIVVPRGKTRVVAGPGNDTIFAADGRREVVDCGPGVDTVYADRIDVLLHCEHVHYATRVSTRR